MKKILVTGGAGFIGSYLCEFLLKKGHTVICLDNLFTGDKENIKHLMQDKNFSFIEHDIIDPLEIEPVDQIYNLACPASPIHYQHNPIRTVQANTVGVNNMLSMAMKHNARLLQASTSEVYGDPLENPQRETYLGNVNPIGPRACYDEGKRVAETLCFDYHREHNVEIRVVRIFNTYGPKMTINDGRVVTNFIVQALKGEPITVYGDGTHTRSFCFVTDLVRGLYAMMNSEITGPVNLGNPTELTINQIAETIKELTQSSSEIVHRELPKDDPKVRRPDITLAKQSLNWEPEIALREGLEKAIAYFRKHPGIQIPGV